MHPGAETQNEVEGDFNVFSTRIASWNRVLAQCTSSERRLIIFREFGRDLPAYVSRGLGKADGVDALQAAAVESEGEAVCLFKQAWPGGYHGLAAVMAVAWSTHLWPGDVRALGAFQFARDGAGMAFFAERRRRASRSAGLSVTARWPLSRLMSPNSSESRPGEIVP